jgi:hypothetical protein
MLFRNTADVSVVQRFSAANAGRVQLIDATLYLFIKRWSVSNGLPNTDQVHSNSKGGDMGSLAARFGPTQKQKR